MPRLLEDWMSGYMDYVANEEPPRIFQLAVGVGVISSCLQRKCWFSRGKLLWYPNLYILLVGKSGSRKSYSMRRGMELMDGLSVSFTPARITNAEIVRVLANSSYPVTMPDGRETQHCSLTIFSEEILVLLRGDGEMIEILTDWYDCHDKWENRTKFSGIDVITNEFVTLIGATTTQKLASLPKDKMEGGFIGRLLVAYAEKRHHSEPEPANTPFHESLKEKLQIDLSCINQLKGPFQDTPEAKEAYKEWYFEQDKHPPFNDDIFCGYVDRRAMNLNKLMMIFSASRSDSMKIEIQDFKRAVSFMELLEGQMKYAFSGVGDNKLVLVQNQIEDLVNLREEVSASEVMALFKRYISMDDLFKILATLRGAGVIDVVKDGNGKNILRKKKS
jgi:hypothetical protein